MEPEDGSGGGDAARALLSSWPKEERENRFPQFLRELAVRFAFFCLETRSEGFCAFNETGVMRKTRERG